MPLLHAIFLFEYAGKRLVFHFLPIARTGAPTGQLVNHVFLVLIVVGLLLSLRRRT